MVDCYNANPSSMRASVENFLAEPLGRRTARVLILGDMLELGEWAAEEHAAVVRLALQGAGAFGAAPLPAGTATQLLLVGPEFARAVAALPRKPAATELFASREELLERLRTRPVENALVLLKGSRGIGLEKALEAL